MLSLAQFKKDMEERKAGETKRAKQAMGEDC